MALKIVGSSPIIHPRKKETSRWVVSFFLGGCGLQRATRGRFHGDSDGSPGTVDGSPLSGTAPAVRVFLRVDRSLSLHFARKSPSKLQCPQYIVIFLQFLIPHLVFRQIFQSMRGIMLPSSWDAGGLPPQWRRPLLSRSPSPLRPLPAPQAAHPECVHSGAEPPLHLRRR